jgi:4'-phosphopantetheinyl transferase
VIELGPRDATLWHADPDAIVDPALLRAYFELLDPGQQSEQQRFYFESGRKLYLVAQALVRTALSAHAPVDPRRWRFSRNEHGRPDIAEPVLARRLAFNLSHTEGRTAVVVALHREIGVDVEAEDRKTEIMRIADRFFSPFEVSALRALPFTEQRERFFAYWTLKESYIKARGMGLAIPLAHFSFLLDAGPEIRVTFDPRLNDDPTTWQFARFRVSTRHPIAVAVRRGHEADLGISVREVIPLAKP